MIENKIVAYIPRASRGFPPTVSLNEIVKAIVYKLKTGAQWEQLSARALFERTPLSWQSVYHHCRKWCGSGHAFPTNSAQFQ